MIVRKVVRDGLKMNPVKGKTRIYELLQPFFGEVTYTRRKRRGGGPKRTGSGIR